MTTAPQHPTWTPRTTPVPSGPVPAADPAAAAAAAPAGAAGWVPPTPVPTEPGPQPTAALPPEALWPAAAGDAPQLQRLLSALVAADGSDLHLSAGQPPWFRIRGQLLPATQERRLTSEEVSRMLAEVVDPDVWRRFLDRGDADTAYAMRSVDGAPVDARFRLNLHRSLGQVGMVGRFIPSTIPTLDELGLPSQVKKLAERRQGLVLVCGPTGSGKTSTQAALLDLINETRHQRIFTFEDPVEFIHTPKKCLVSHREIGPDTAEFTDGLRAVRRQDPNIIMVGELRDYESMQAAIEAASSGHLVLATMHTNNARETVATLINFFPSERQNQIRALLASTLAAVVVQALVPSARSPRGRVLATEIMMVTAAIRNSILENNLNAIDSALVDTSTGSIGMDAHLAQLLRRGLVEESDALRYASSPEDLRRQLSTR